jgi:surfactin synthase thioesterase subunit
MVDLPGRDRSARTTAETAIKPLADELVRLFQIGEIARI